MRGLFVLRSCNVLPSHDPVPGEYWIPFLRHKWLFVITVTSILLITVGYTMLKPTTYTAAYTVIVGTRQVQSPLGSPTDDPWQVMNRIISELSTDVSTTEFMQAALTLPDGHPRPLENQVDLNSESAMCSGSSTTSRSTTITRTSSDAVTLSNYPRRRKTQGNSDQRYQRVHSTRRAGTGRLLHLPKSINCQSGS